MFYEIAYQMWLRDGGLSPKKNPEDPIETMAKAYGFGKRTGIDLPSEYRGRVGGREFKKALYEQLHDAWCKRAKTGYPEVATTDPAKARLLKAYAKENCVDGDQYRGGDAVNISIGQGDTVATPLQVAQAYAALANGGTIWTPQVAKGIVAGDGTVVSRVDPVKAGTLPVSKANMAYLRDAFERTTSDPSGTGHGPFIGFPLDQIPVATKTGTGQAGQNKQSTSWFASYAPANNPKYVVVMMVSQGGTGSGTSGPSVRKIYEAIYGVSGSKVDPSKSVLTGGKPSTRLPTIRKDGTPVYPELPETAASAAPVVPFEPSTPATPAAGLLVPVGLGLLGRSARRRRGAGPPTAQAPWVIARGSP
jgi:penicillin-binding protein 2